MREELLDRDRIVDQRQIVAEHRARGRREFERPILDEAYHGERCHPFHAARGRKAHLGGVRDLPAAISEAVGPLEDDLVAPIDANDPGERRLDGEGVDRLGELGHARTLAV